MLMDSHRLIFDSSSSPSHMCHGNMFFFGGGNQVTFRGEGGRSVLSMDEACLTAGASAGKRRPFFTTAQQLMIMDDDDYYYDEQPEKKRRLTVEQVQILETSFEEESKLEPEKKNELAKKLGLQPRQVAVWFQNRRARWKTKQLERDFDRLKSSYDSLLADRDSLLKDNFSLRSQILSLTEKLQAKNSAVAGSTTIGGGASVGGGLVGRPQTAVASNTGNGVAAAAIFGPSKIDHLSSGTGGSTDVYQESPQLVDSGDSHLPDDVGRGCGVGALEGGGVQSEEEDGSDIDGRGYLFGVFEDAAETTASVVGHSNQQPEEVWNALGWWVWS